LNSRNREECSEFCQALELWYERRAGDEMLNRIRGAVEQCLRRAFGYHVLQLGVTRAHPLYRNGTIPHFSYCTAQSGSASDLVADSAELPLQSDCVDALIVHHALEFSGRPHQALREMVRVLMPHGHLVVVAFDPWSVLGAGNFLRGVAGSPLWRGCQPLNHFRLRDWLRLLGCETESCLHIPASPPGTGHRFTTTVRRWERWYARQGLPLGGIYVLHAMKQVPGRNRPRLLAPHRAVRLVGLSRPNTAAVPGSVPRTAHGHSSGDLLETG